MDKIIFKDVAAEHLNRYQLIKVTGTEDQYDLIPVYGTVSQEGTPVRALELNELQENIDASKQDSITARGILKGDGQGGILTASSESDYATPGYVNGQISAHDSASGAHADLFDAKLDKTGGTINGALTVSGTLTVSTGTLYANSGIGLPTKSAIIKTTAGGLTTGATAGTDYEQVTIGGTTTRGYAKFASGLLICWGKQNFGSQAVTNPWGALYESSRLTFTNFAYTFSAVPVVTAMPNEESSASFFVEGMSGTTTTSPGYFYADRPNSATIGTTCASYVAIGRWKS